MTRAQEIAFERWLQDRPAIVQVLARKYPPGTKFRLHGRQVWLMSYEESGGLSVSPIDPAEDYEKAVASREPICPCCLPKLDELKIT